MNVMDWATSRRCQFFLSTTPFELGIQPFSLVENSMFAKIALNKPFIFSVP
jgi:hypothetical protein